MNKAVIIGSSEKKGTKTEKSEYTFHISSYSTKGKISVYEALFTKAGENKNLHYHKIVTETFTVLEGEFYFNIEDEEYIFGANDSIVIPPMVVHGFRAKLPNSRLLIVFTDSETRDDFFIELADFINGKIIMTDDEKEDFFNRFDQYSVT
jgi:mannose-6-phosphate isomerase-like protein (cupin superfamily)